MGTRRFVLHARIFVGGLDKPDRNELRTADGDDRASLEEVADLLRERGYRCWLYERIPPVEGSLLVPGRPERFTTLREWKPDR